MYLTRNDLKTDPIFICLRPFLLSLPKTDFKNLDLTIIKHVQDQNRML